MTKLLTTTEFAKLAGVHPETVRRWVKAGHLKPGYTPGGHMRFTEEHASELLGTSGSEGRMTPVQFAIGLGVKPTLVKRWIWDGRLKPEVHTPIGTALFSQAQLDRMLAEKARRPDIQLFRPEVASREPGTKLTREEELAAYRKATLRLAKYRWRQNLRKLKK